MTLEAVELIIERIQSSKSASERIMATRALLRLGADASPAIPFLIDSLTDPQISDSVMWVLGTTGEAAIGPLEQAANGKNLMLSRMAIWALGRYTHFADRRVDSLIPFLKGSRVEVRKVAIMSLNRLRKGLYSGRGGLMNYPISSDVRGLVNKIESILDTHLRDADSGV